MPKQFKIAIIGTGAIAKAHARDLKKLAPRATVVAGVDVDRARVEAFCTEHGIPKPYTDIAKMLAEQKPDVVHVCTPPALHCDISIQCMEAGAWVLCEKPLCGSLSVLNKLDAAEKRTGRYVSSVFQWRFGSGGQHLKRLIDSKELGKPTVGVCNTTWYRGLDYYTEVPWRGRWETELGGPTMIHGIHAMDFFLWLLGDWTEVRAMTTTLDRAIQVEDISMAIVKFASGAMGSIVNSILCPRQESYIRLDFQNATIELAHLYGYGDKNWRFFARDEHQKELERWKTLPVPEVSASHGSQAAALMDSLEKGQRPLVSGKEVRRTLEFITSLYKSASTGCGVKPGSIGKDDPFYHHVAGYVAK